MPWQKRDMLVGSQMRELLDLAVGLFQLPAAGRSGNAQEDQNRTIQPHHILVGEAADTRAELRLWNGRDLIQHQPADGRQAISLTWLNGQPKQRSIGRISGKCTHRDGIRHVETIVVSRLTRSMLILLKPRATSRKARLSMGSFVPKLQQNNAVGRAA